MRNLQHFPYKSCLVLGLAKSGTAVSRLLLDNGIRVLANDKNGTEMDPNVLALKSLGADVVVGSHPLELLSGVDVIIKNPGIPYENELLQEAMKQNIPILTEIELLYYFEVQPLIAITGSNGKTTSTMLTYEMLKSSTITYHLAGNIGHVASEVARDMEAEEGMVAELSSFQLQGVEKLKPKIAIVLNIFEAHLDYHHTLDNYQKAKSNIFINQDKNDYLIYNADDTRVTQMVAHANSTKIPFSRKKELPDGIYSTETAIYFKNEKIIDLESISLVGEHNIENILAAVGAAKLSGASNEAIVNVLTTFTGVKHRLQYVKSVSGRSFYNDSKATNLLATKKALSAFNKPTILLAGGLDRGNGFEDLVSSMSNVKGMIVFGETADKLKELAKKENIPHIYHATNMDQAVKQAYAISNKDDVILLSPACASWDQYKTFEERGDMFIDAVHKL
ncbi:UDP-N-acetylmuramoylalanine--D-glutamate ligase [Gracilibacillus halotolerans]|uniref:UDP-N-acetylmuramoylalanine--D-glutamate ligase n=1 Tax=Gracilibacillus halotolerans TaxID=74386 RepID=A0A841RK55_9BACI|nr:UDP-N-acetylmuramoyl-L-alanine--D-glutamate ligase [Gracilibacillus halotolerans]MBB6511354.1 UDP-N-acetylmuramoylalanine--D-glutamate ligase [Gracilibacillus halotolerans]